MLTLPRRQQRGYLTLVRAWRSANPHHEPTVIARVARSADDDCCKKNYEIVLFAWSERWYLSWEDPSKPVLIKRFLVSSKRVVGLNHTYHLLSLVSVAYYTELKRITRRERERERISENGVTNVF